MTTPLSASQDSSLSETATRAIVEEVQFWIDNPSLERASLDSSGHAPEELKRDVKQCLDLLRAGPVVDANEIGQTDEPKDDQSLLRFANPEAIGAGTFGIVFRAFDRTLKRHVAIKILRTAGLASKSIRARFSLEGEALARCNFEGIIPVYEVGNLCGTPYLVMRWIDGPNLEQWLRMQAHPVSARVAARLISSIAHSIHLAHQNGILHRDIKPSNVMLAPKGSTSADEFSYQPFVSDFGLAKELQPGLSQETTDLSLDSPIVGTVRYMSPEQAAGKASEVSITSDIYSLGVILYELLTLQSPFVGHTKLEIIHRIINESPRSANTLVASVPRELNAILLKCLDKNPKKRYQTAMDLSEDLDRFLQCKPVLAKPDGPIATVLKWGRRNPWIAAALIVIWCGTLVSSAVIFGLYQRSQRSLQAEKNALELALKSVRETYQFVAEKTLMDVPNSNATKLKLHLKALSFFQQFAEHSRFDERSTHLLSIAHHYVANAYFNLQDFDNHHVHRTECLALVQRLIEQHPNTAEYHFDLFMNRYQSIYARFGDPNEIALSSLPPLERALALDPKNIDYRDALSACYLQCSVLSKSTNAQDLLRKSIEISKALVEEFPDRPLFRKSLANTYIALGRQNTIDKLFAESIEPITKGLDIIEGQTRNQPRSIAFLELEVNGLFHLVNALLHLDSPNLESTLELFNTKSRELEMIDKKFKSAIVMRGQAIGFQVQFLERHNRAEEARQVLDQFLPELEKFVAPEADGRAYVATFESLREARAKLGQPTQQLETPSEKD